MGIPRSYQSASRGSPRREYGVRTIEEETQETEEDDALEDVVMAVDVRGRETIGCCYYVARDEKLYYMAEVKLADLQMIETCLLLPQYLTSVLSLTSSQ